MRKNYAIAVFFAITQITSGAVTIETKLGHVRGTVMLSRNGKRFNAFLGLPYAKPPVGELRFKVRYHLVLANNIVCYICTKLRLNADLGSVVIRRDVEKYLRRHQIPASLSAT